MLSDLLQKLEGQHGIAPEQGQSILNTITQHIKENFPSIGGMLDGVLGQQAAANQTSSTTAQTAGNESTLQKLEDLAKSKLGGMI